MDSSASAQDSAACFPMKFHFVLPIDGFQEECVLFLKEVVALPVFNFTTFRELYFNCKFDRLYEGRPSKDEVMEMSEQVLITVATQFFSMNASYKERAAALFLLYILALSQPIPEFAKIPIIPDDLQYLQIFLEEARLRQDKEVLFCWATILVRGYCEFTCERQEYGLEDSLQKYFDEMTDDDTILPLRNIKEEFTIMENFTVKMKKYNELKKKYIMRQAGNNKDRKVLEEKWKKEIESRETIANDLMTGLRNMVTGNESIIKRSNIHIVHSEKIENLKKQASWSQVRNGRYLASTSNESVILPDAKTQLDDDDDYRDSDLKLELNNTQLPSNPLYIAPNVPPLREVSDRIKDRMMTCRDALQKQVTQDDDCSQDSLYFIPPLYPTMVIDDYSQPPSPAATCTSDKDTEQQAGPSCGS